MTTGKHFIIVLAIFATFNAASEGPRALPTPEQVAWQDMEIGMFLCLAPNTWQDREYDDMSTPLDQINPEKLDTDQWVEVAKSMGAQYIIFVAKHTSGFCLWQTDTSSYGIKETPWRGGKGDILADLAESCRKGGVKLGVYVSPRDDTYQADTGGTCATPELQEKYNAIFRQQWVEVLSRYGEMCEVWFDGGNVVELGDILKKYAPKAMVFQGKYATIRWVGNENGIAPYPAWNCVSEEARLRGATAKDGDPNGDAWLPNECDARIRSTWFWNTKNADTLKTLDQLMDMYYQSVGHGAVLLLNNTPDTTGLIPEADVKRSAEFGAEIKRRFGTSLADTQGEGESVELAMSASAPVDHVITMEDITQGERVLEYVIEGRVDGEWKELVRGTAIGHKKIDRFAPVELNRLRFRCIKSNGVPIIRKLAAHSVGTK